MHHRIGRLSVRGAITCFLLLAAASVAVAEEAWQAGVARVKITPTERMWLSGYAGRNKPAEGTLHDLWAKALVLRDSKGQRAVLVTLDLVGIDRDHSQMICRRVVKKYAFARSEIALCTSHTHTGPVVGRNLIAMYRLDDRQKKLKDAYTNRLTEQIEQLVGRAIKDLSPARLSWAVGKATFAINRRPQKKGPVDHDVPVLAVREAKGDKLRAVVFGYACHATVLAFYQWSGDYPGFAQIHVEKDHPGCVAMFWAGCGGDQNPSPRRSVELADQHGRHLANAVGKMLGGQMRSVTGRLSVAYKEVALPFEKGDKPYPYPIQAWRIGSDVRFIALGGEVTVDYALRLKHELGGQRTWVAGYSNDVMAYIPSRRVWNEGGYEGGGAMGIYGLRSRWTPEVEEIIVREVHGLVKSLAER